MELYHAGVPEKVIQERTGLDSMRGQMLISNMQYHEYSCLARIPHIWNRLLPATQTPVITNRLTTE